MSRYDYDVIVVGSGHSGCEAALASAGLGCKTLMLTLNMENIALMPCNPSIGGPGKGHLVREIDALGGEMGKNIDRAYIQLRWLNTKKGPAVRALRAQADKYLYSREMKRRLESQDGLQLRQETVNELLIDNGVIKGVRTNEGSEYRARCVVVTSGTYLNGMIHIGEVRFPSGPYGQHPAEALARYLKEKGFPMRRFKTGTPARIDGRSIDFSKTEEQHGMDLERGFSFFGEFAKREQAKCWITYTNPETHRIIRENIHRAAMYSGAITGIGPRYCPSIESKVMGFPDKDGHQVFLEPEGLYSKEIYISGMSTSLPRDVQILVYRSVKGLENAEITRFGYAIEYDSIDPLSLKSTLEYRDVDGLFFAGQVNGTSGYEEAAAQGIIAGINAALKAGGGGEFVIGRDEGYIGVLIDDIVTKGVEDPYRIMTSRAEYRLYLREGNADLRLSEKGYRVGLLDEKSYKAVVRRREMIGMLQEKLESHQLNPSDEVNDMLRNAGINPIENPTTLAQILRRPEVSFKDIVGFLDGKEEFPEDVISEVEINIKYEGYIKKQKIVIERHRRMENMAIPPDFDYDSLVNVSSEALEKMKRVRPESVGQASRISGVSPSDISFLLMALKQRRGKRLERHDDTEVSKPEGKTKEQAEKQD